MFEQSGTSQVAIQFNRRDDARLTDDEISDGSLNFETKARLMLDEWLLISTQGLWTPQEPT